MLRGLAQGDRVEHQRRDRRVELAGRQRGPQEVDLGQGVVEAHGVAHVLQGRVAQLAGGVVHDQAAFAVGAAGEWRAVV